MKDFVHVEGTVLYRDCDSSYTNLRRDEMSQRHTEK